jgi:hypothetical protein
MRDGSTNDEKHADKLLLPLLRMIIEMKTQVRTQID